jgi:hypothetical protein
MTATANDRELAVQIIERLLSSGDERLFEAAGHNLDPSGARHRLSLAALSATDEIADAVSRNDRPIREIARAAILRKLKAGAA